MYIFCLQQNLSLPLKPAYVPIAPHKFIVVFHMQTFNNYRQVEQNIVAWQLFAGHMVSSQPIEKKKKSIE